MTSKQEAEEFLRTYEHDAEKELMDDLLGMEDEEVVDTSRSPTNGSQD